MFSSTNPLACHKLSSSPAKNECGLLAFHIAQIAMRPGTFGLFQGHVQTRKSDQHTKGSVRGAAAAAPYTVS